MSFIKPIPVFIGPAAFFHAHFGNRDKVPSTGSDVVEVVPCVILPGLTMVSAEKCRDAFFEPANFEILSSVSGGSTIAKIDYWEHTSEMDIHAAYVLNMSELSASYCWSQGFKYWELALNRNLYFDSWIHELGTSVECEGCAELRKRVEELAIKVFIGLCVPEICSETEIREEVSPGYLMNVLNSPIPFPVPGEPQLDVTELSHWSQFQLDLIIAGLDNCGTTSLGRWLQQVQSIELSNLGEEDDFFFRNDRLLPFRSEVEEFNSQWKSRQTLKALRHPNLWAHLRVRMALARIPQLKVLLVVCDPLSRIDKAFWWYHICDPPLPHPEIAPLVRPKGCFESISSVLEPSFLDRFKVQRHVEHLKQLYQHRLRVVHQAYMRESAWDTFVQIAGWIGVSVVSAEVRLGRHNHRPGHRTDLCRNSTLVNLLKVLLSSEQL
ncbi:unnamed protein product [Durusdinium trenchii]|uniref:Sulfotransferase n=2 Tax=Durusdinium trenchii TaxID=1381693 RepID=A0ABP0JQQ1_9DINO